MLREKEKEERLERQLAARLALGLGPPGEGDDDAESKPEDTGAGQLGDISTIQEESPDVDSIEAAPVSNELEEDENPF